jgi:hypothetical protein
MGSLPPEAEEIAHSDRVDGVSSLATNVSPEVLDPHGTNEADLTEKSTEDEQRPIKRQKQESLSIDDSPALPVSGTTSAALGTADAATALTTSADDIDEDYSNMIHPSVAEIIKLESIPSVEPLECLSPREVAGKLDSIIAHPFSRPFLFGAH